MGWKTINGRQYYYRCVREGARVRSEYYGAGVAGNLRAQVARMDAEDLAMERSLFKEQQDAWNEIDDALDDLAEQARHAAADLLTRAGYHRHHRGEWRKRRGNRNREEAPDRVDDGQLGE